MDSLISTPEAFDALKERLKLEEGYRSYVYKDARGNDTIGYGHLLSNGFSRPVADAILFYDIMEKEEELRAKCPEYNLQAVEVKSVLLDMSFNIGVGGLLQFKDLWASLNVKNRSGAATAMRNSAWYKEVGERGEFLAKMMEG